MSKRSPKTLSELEHVVMQVIWSEGSLNAEQIRHHLSPKRPLRDSTIRTVLRRLEEKGFLRHTVEGRTYIYESVVPQQKAAARAIHNVVNRFCAGSIEDLLIGMVNDRMISRKQLEQMSQMIAKSESQEEE